MSTFVEFPTLPDGLAVTQAVTPLQEQHDRLSARIRAIRREREANAREEERLISERRAEEARAYRLGTEPEVKGFQTEINALSVKNHDLQTEAMRANDGLEQIAKELPRLVKANSEAWALEAEGRMAGKRERARAALDAYRTEITGLAELEATIRWVRAEGKGKTMAIFPTGVPGIFRHDRTNLHSWLDVVQSLETMLDEPAGPDPEAIARSEAAKPMQTAHRRALADARMLG